MYSAGSEAEVVALHGVDLRIEPGEFVAIMGPSGSGKSTLMNLIGCLDTPTSGTYRCDGVDVATLDAEERARPAAGKIGFVFQGFNLLPRMSALENVAMPMGYANIARDERAAARAGGAARRSASASRAHHRPSELSGGQQQRVAIARALINRPPILLADEPTGALDSRTGEEILALFKQLRDEDHTVMLITHDAASRRACRPHLRDARWRTACGDRAAGAARMNSWKSCARRCSRCAATGCAVR